MQRCRPKVAVDEGDVAHASFCNAAHQRISHGNILQWSKRNTEFLDLPAVSGQSCSQVKHRLLVFVEETDPEPDDVH